MTLCQSESFHDSSGYPPSKVIRTSPSHFGMAIFFCQSVSGIGQPLTNGGTNDSMCLEPIRCNRHQRGRSLLRVCLRTCRFGLVVVLFGWSLVGCQRAKTTDDSLATNSKAHWQDFVAKHSESVPAADRSVGSDASEGEIRPSRSVGSAECTECHQEQTASYLQTSHHRSARWIQDSGAHVPARFTHQPSNRLYEVTLSSNGLAHSEKVLGPGGELIASDSADLVLELGSGLHAHSYLMQRDGFWVQSPLTWYSQPQRWDLSPGYDAIEQATFDRAINSNCAFCHVGQIRTRGDDLYRFSIHEISIGCERCHGPGHDHVMTRRAAQQDSKVAAPSSVKTAQDVVNPVNLSREAQEAICSQCHLQGVMFASASGVSHWDFVPGDLLSDSITVYQLDGIDQQFKIVGHTEQLHASACYLQTDTLTCITCHDPHAPPPSREEARQACLQCHQDDHQSNGCSVPEADRIRTQQNDCSVCHMPIRPTNVTHAALHDHRIAVHDRSYALASIEPPASDRSLQSNKPDMPRLVAITDESKLEPWQQMRRWSMAMHSLAFRDLMPTELMPQFERAKETLLQLHRQGITDPSIQVSLAKDYLAANMLAPCVLWQVKSFQKLLPGNRRILAQRMCWDNSRSGLRTTSRLCIGIDN